MVRVRPFLDASADYEGNGMMRVITGIARGRRLETLNGEDVTRPTTESVKEALFSMIQFELEDKKVLFVTDTRHINPNIADTPLDCALIEANYSLQYVVENFEKVTNFGYKNHLSIESVCEWLDSRQFKPNNLVLIHLSQSGNIEPTRALEAVRERIPTAELASQNLRITV